jgi:plastocyanin
MRRSLVPGFLAAFLGIPFAQAAELSGQVQVVGRPAQAQVPTYVYAEPLGRAPSPVPVRAKLLQRRKTFLPRTLVLPVGSTVDFLNEDTIFHNVFSLSPPQPFDLGLYRAGATRSRTFNKPGLYRVFCNIHPQMTAVLLVVPTSFITEVDASGGYRLDLPPGRYRLTAWSERSQPETTEVVVGAASVAAPELTLDESKFVELRHKNKYGQEYPKDAYRRPKEPAPH